MVTDKNLPKERLEELFKILKARFEKNKIRHKDLEWPKIQATLEACLSGRQANLNKIWSLNEMEETGGEPDVIGFDEKTEEFIFYDCSVESPKGRRSVCYDH